MLSLSTLSLGIIGGADGPTAVFVITPDEGTLGIVLLYLLLVNLLTFLMYGVDKRNAQAEKPRIEERTLLLLPLLGGSVGALLGMRFFHHKTRHWYFRYGIPLLLLLQLALGLAFCFLPR
ncbi:MAG: DUF1294 domain-containing protein [Oscillospiraceae bacterium]